MENELKTHDFEEKYRNAGFVAKRLIGSFFAELDAHLSPYRPKSVVDVGCGPGISTKRLISAIPAGTPVTAVDVEPEMVAACRQRNPGIDVRQENIYRLGFSDGQFDLVVCLEVLEHLDDPQRGLSELRRIGTDILVASVPNEPLWRILNLCRGKYVGQLGNTPGHLQHWSPRRFIEFLSGAGSIVKVSRPLPWTMVTVRLRK